MTSEILHLVWMLWYFDFRSSSQETKHASIQIHQYQLSHHHMHWTSTNWQYFVDLRGHPGPPPSNYFMCVMWTLTCVAAWAEWTTTGNTQSVAYALWVTPPVVAPGYCLRWCGARNYVARPAVDLVQPTVTSIIILHLPPMASPRNQIWSLELELKPTKWSKLQ